MKNKLIKQLEEAISEHECFVMFLDEILSSIHSTIENLEKEDRYIHKEEICKKYLSNLIRALESDINMAKNKIHCAYKHLNDLHNIDIH